MPRRLSHLPFVSIFDRGNGVYDIAELPRVIAYTASICSPLPRGNSISIMISYNRESLPRVISLEFSSNRMIIYDNGREVDRIEDLLSYLRNLIRDILSNAMSYCVPISDTDTQIVINEAYTILHTTTREHVYYIGIKPSDVQVLPYRQNMCMSDIKYLWNIRTSSLKGILRYALFKLVVLYSMYCLVYEQCMDDVIAQLLLLFSRIITYDDECFVYEEKDDKIPGVSLGLAIPLLHSIIFGSTMNKSLISLDFLEEYSTQNTVRYSVNTQYNSILSLILLDNILNKFKNYFTCVGSISIEYLINGLLCLIIGSLNFIDSLKGPFVPILPGYSSLREIINCVFIQLNIPNYFKVEELIELADNFLKFYVCEYILKNIHVKIRR